MDSFSTHVDVIRPSRRCCAVMKYWLLNTFNCYHISFNYVNFFISCHNKIPPGMCEQKQLCVETVVSAIFESCHGQGNSSLEIKHSVILAVSGI